MKTIDGSCHCGAVRFTASFVGDVETSKCDCSICAKSRFWKTMVPADAFDLTKGEAALRSYRFGSKGVDHRICATCGVKVYGSVSIAGTDYIAVSVPCLDLTPEELAALPVTFQDGRHEAYDREPEVTSYL